MPTAEGVLDMAEPKTATRDAVTIVDQRTGKSYDLPIALNDRAAHDPAHEVALQAEEDDQRQDHADEGGRRQQDACTGQVFPAEHAVLPQQRQRRYRI